jgi:hypothetical protein
VFGVFGKDYGVSVSGRPHASAATRPIIRSHREPVFKIDQLGWPSEDGRILWSLGVMWDALSDIGSAQKPRSVFGAHLIDF